MADTFTVDQDLPATLTFTDAHGNTIAAPAGVPTWAVDNAAIYTITAAADGMSATLVSVAPGVANVTASLDGVTSVPLAVTVTAGMLAGITITLGDAVAKS